MNSQKVEDLSIKEELAKYPVWSCDLEKDHRDLDQLTVGDGFYLQCHGDYINSLSMPVSIQLPEKSDSEYKLKLFKLVKSENEAITLYVTSYKPGDHNLSFIVKGHDSGIEVKDLKFTIQSVIEKKEGEQPVPFGPLGPFSLEYPSWIWFFFGLPALLLLALLIRLLVKVWKKRTLIEELRAEGFLSTRYSAKMLSSKEYSTNGLNVYQNFCKQIRLLKRKAHLPEKLKKQPYSTADYLQDLTKEFKLYLKREFVLPADRMSLKNSYKAVKKENPYVMKKYGLVLLKVIQEYLNAQKSLGEIQLQDCDQIAEMTLNITGKIHGFLHKGERL